VKNILGVLGGGLTGTAAAGLGVPVDAHLALVAAIGLVGGQAATLALVDTPRAAGPSLALPRGPLLGVGAIAFCAFLVDGAANNWSAVHVADTGAGEGVAAAAFAAFASGLVTGRLTGDRGDAPRVFRRSGLVTTVGMALVLLAPVPPLALAGWFVVGLGVAPVAPTVMRAAGPAPASIAAVTTIGYLGSFTGPPLIGGLATLTTLSAALTIVLAASLAVFASAGRVRHAARAPSDERRGAVENGGRRVLERDRC